jgi:hypothetical protein
MAGTQYISCDVNTTDCIEYIKTIFNLLVPHAASDRTEGDPRGFMHGWTCCCQFRRTRSNCVTGIKSFTFVTKTVFSKQAHIPELRFVSLREISNETQDVYFNRLRYTCFASVLSEFAFIQSLHTELDHCVSFRSFCLSFSRLYLQKRVSIITNFDDHKYLQLMKLTWCRGRHHYVCVLSIIWLNTRIQAIS